jgi:hypothetical protein
LAFGKRGSTRCVNNHIMYVLLNYWIKEMWVAHFVRIPEVSSSNLGPATSSSTFSRLSRPPSFILSATAFPTLPFHFVIRLPSYRWTVFSLSCWQNN